MSGLSGAGSGAAIGTAIAPGIGTAIGGGLGLVTGLFGGGDDKAEQAAALQKEAAELYDKFGPVDLSNPIIFKQFSDAGLLSPQMQQALNLNMSKDESITENAGDLTQQKAALESLKQLSQTGLSAQDMAASRELQNKVGQDTESRNKQLLLDAQQRGQSGNGATLAAQLANNQQASQNESEHADQLAAQGSSARAQALAQLFAGTGQVRQQDTDTQKFNTQNDILRSQFLDQNAAARQQANTNAQNQANLYNLQRQQSVADRNTQQGNAELLRQQQAKEQYFQDQMAQANAKGNAYNGQANSLNNQASNQAQGWSNVMQGLGQAATAYGQYKNNSNSSPASSSSGAPTSSDSFSMPQLGSQYSSPSYSFSEGGMVPEDGTEVPGNSPENDTKNAKLSGGEMVIPRSMMSSPEHAKAFVDHEFNNNEKSEKETLMTMLAHMNNRLHHLESK